MTKQGPESAHYQVRDQKQTLSHMRKLVQRLEPPGDCVCACVRAQLSRLSTFSGAGTLGEERAASRGGCHCLELLSL